MPAGWQARHLLGWLCGKPQRDTWAWEQGWCAARVRDARFPWHNSGQGGTPVQQRVRCATRSSRGTTACNHAALESRVGRHSPRHSCTRVQGCAAGRSRHTCWWGRGTASPRRRAAVWRCQQSVRGVTRGFHACVRRGHAHVGGVCTRARRSVRVCGRRSRGRAVARARVTRSRCLVAVRMAHAPKCGLARHRKLKRARTAPRGQSSGVVACACGSGPSQLRASARSAFDDVVAAVVETPASSSCDGAPSEERDAGGGF